MGDIADAIYAELKVKLNKEVKDKADSAIKDWKDSDGMKRIKPLIKEDFEYSVNKFYGDYHPKHDWQYDESTLSRWGLKSNLKTRLGDLKNIMVIDGDGLRIRIGFSPDLLSNHRESKAHIYDNSFVQGYHGGPTWRTPYSIYSRPLRAAKQTKSPLNIFKGRLQKTTKKKIEESWEDYIKKYFADK